MGLRTRVEIEGKGTPLKPDECDAAGPYISLLFNDLDYHCSSDSLCPSFLRSLAMPNPTQKTTITRYVHIVAEVDRPYWGPTAKNWLRSILCVLSLASDFCRPQPLRDPRTTQYRRSTQHLCSPGVRTWVPSVPWLRWGSPTTDGAPIQVSSFHQWIH